MVDRSPEGRRVRGGPNPEGSNSRATRRAERPPFSSDERMAIRVAPCTSRSPHRSVRAGGWHLGPDLGDSLPQGLRSIVRISIVDGSEALPLTADSECKGPTTSMPVWVLTEGDYRKRLQRSDLPPSRARIPGASRSNWTHFVHQSAFVPGEHALRGRLRGHGDHLALRKARRTSRHDLEERVPQRLVFGLVHTVRVARHVRRSDENLLWVVGGDMGDAPDPGFVGKSMKIRRSARTGSRPGRRKISTASSDVSTLK